MKSRLLRERILYFIIAMLILTLLYRINKNPHSIPRHIIQTTKSRDSLLDYEKQSMQAWVDLNPGYTHHVYDDTECFNYIKTNYGNRVADAFDRLIPGAFKADLFRYCILYKQGGVYADLDTIPLKCIDYIISKTGNKNFVSSLERLAIPGVYQAFIACRPGCEWLRIAIDMIVDNVENRRIFDGSDGVPFSMFLSTTGPILLGKAIKKYLNSDEIPKITDEWYLLQLSDNCLFLLLDDDIVIQADSDFAMKSKYNSENYYQNSIKKGQIYKE